MLADTYLAVNMLTKILSILQESNSGKRFIYPDAYMISD